MCGRYVRRSDKQRIAEAFRLGELPEGFVLPPDYNVAPSTFQPVIRLHRDTHQREIVLMSWGLVPFFTKDLKDIKGLSTINARSETVATAGTFREAFRKRRCLVPVDGFYEWRKLAGQKLGQLASTPVTEGTNAPVESALDNREVAADKRRPNARRRALPTAKQPFVFTLTSAEPFALAGIWDAWREPKASPQATDTWLQSFSILTTDANELMTPVHNRMPVILHPRDYDLWLQRAETGSAPADPELQQRLLALLRPFDADRMAAHPANPAVGNVRNNGPEMLAPPPDPPALYPPDPAQEQNSR